MYRKTEQITIRVNPILKDKFSVAIGFLELSAVFSEFMQSYVREYEKSIGQPVPTRIDKAGCYDLINNIYGIKISKDRFDEIQAMIPKTRKNIAIYGD